MAGRTVWYQDIREIHDRYFQESWQERVDDINKRHQLSGAHLLLTHGQGIPMPWFNGDIQSIEPGNWVLVVSLNHQIDADPPAAPAAEASGSGGKDSWWNGRRTKNTDRWYGRFFSPLARVAAAAVGENLAKEEEPAFATKRMIFVEMCPYVSNKFNLPWQAVKELLESDLGFRLASKVNRLLIEKGEPALIMVNGTSAIEMFQHLYADSLEWREIHYDSCDPPQEGRKPKRLRHYCGSLHLADRPVPVVGFPFLRTRSTHNSNMEVAMLGDLALNCVRSQTSDRSAEGASHRAHG